MAVLAMVLFGLIVGPIGAALLGREPMVRLPHFQLAPPTIFHLGGLAVTNTLLSAWLTTVVIVLLFLLGTRRMRLVPTRLQGFLEWVVELLYNFVVSVEVNPPAGLNLDAALRGARMLADAGVDVINSSDGPRATVRVSNSVLTQIIQQQTGLETILHVCCRDRNLLRLTADMFASHVLGLHNLVIITGDPPKTAGDYPHATAVFDLDSIGLLRLVNGLNHGYDPAGKAMKEVTRFFLACGVEPGALDYERELRRLEQKKEAGAEMIMTQPVYDGALLRRLLNDIRHLNLPVLVGLLPLASYQNALFLHHEVPGMQIPAHILQRMEKVDKGSASLMEGVRIAQEALEEVMDDVVGAYIMPPFGRYEAAIKILEIVGYQMPASARAFPGETSVTTDSAVILPPN